MKAISVKQPWASMIAQGVKSIETRTWATRHRGPLLIVASSQPKIGPTGLALVVVELIDCRRMGEGDVQAACCAVYPGAWAWVLKMIGPVDPMFPVRGRLGLYDVPDELITSERGTP